MVLIMMMPMLLMIWLAHGWRSGTLFADQRA
jgi:hypothetical protein